MSFIKTTKFQEQVQIKWYDAQSHHHHHLNDFHDEIKMTHSAISFFITVDFPENIRHDDDAADDNDDDQYDDHADADDDQYDDSADVAAANDDVDDADDDVDDADDDNADDADDDADADNDADDDLPLPLGPQRTRGLGGGGGFFRNCLLTISRFFLDICHHHCNQSASSLQSS